MKNPEVFNAAKAAYAQGDYQEALRGYYRCLKEQMNTFAPGEAGLVMHMIGNCLIKMRFYDEAVEAYRKALIDEAYTNISAIRANSGMALLSSGHYEGAIEQFNAVLKDPSYATPYKIYSGLGSAYMQLDDLASAGTAYRSAAVDRSNPNPVKALLNLGVCFMGLNRPLDAVETYKTVFGFEPDAATLHKTYANLGQAYVALGDCKKALSMFEQAVSDGTYTLTEAASADYQTAKDAIADHSSAPTNSFAAVGSAEADQAVQDAQDSYSDLWEQPVSDAMFDQPAHDYGFYSHDFGSYEMPSNGREAYDAYGQDEAASSYSLYDEMPADSRRVYGAGIPSTENTGFFDATDEQLIAESKRQIKGERRRRHVVLKLLLGLVILVLLLLASGVFAYTQGYGYPSQQAVVENLFKAVNTNGDVTTYWVNGDSTSIKHIMDAVGTTSNVEITYLSQNMTSSEVIAKATLSEGGQVYYHINMVRSQLGWKVNSLEVYYPSEQ